MSTRYILQYKYDTIGDGGWKDEFESEMLGEVRDAMLEHIATFETMKCRIIKLEYSVKETEIGSFIPPEFVS